MALIVSLTSTSLRLPILRHTLLSLLDQRCMPDRIVISLSKEPYLIDEGIVSSRIATYGKSSSEPLFSNKTEEDREKNRRVEIKLY